MHDVVVAQLLPGTVPVLDEASIHLANGAVGQVDGHVLHRDAKKPELVAGFRETKTNNQTQNLFVHIPKWFQTLLKDLKSH